MTTPTNAVPLQVTVRGDVPDGARAYARQKVEHVLPVAHAPVLHAHLVLSLEPDPALERPARIEVSVNVNGVPVRAHVAGRDVHEAADLVEQRLRRRMVQLQDRVRTRHDGSASPLGMSGVVATYPVIRCRTTHGRWMIDRSCGARPSHSNR